MGFGGVSSGSIQYPDIEEPDTEAKKAADKERKQAALASTRNKTVLTSGKGDTSTAATSKHTLLGQA
jgi:hypothetical protein